MKKIKYILLILITIVTVVSCINNNNDELTGNAVTGGLLGVNNPLVSYVVGSGATYVATGSVFQGKIQTNSIDIYKSFTNNATGEVSNEVLLKTVTINDATVGKTINFSFSFTYQELIKDLTIAGNSLPANDGSLNIGDFWNLKYVAKTSNGAANTSGKVTKVAVGTRYAGVYVVQESAYWNSGNLIGGDWNGKEMIIESVNATIYKHVGLAYWDANQYYFTVDNVTGAITVLDVDLTGSGVLLNGSPIMTCTGGTGSYESLTCNSTTALATPDDVNGRDQLEFTVGYFRGVGATREFYERMVKKVK